MYVETAIKILVLGNAGVTALIGDRMSYGFLSQSVREPAIEFKVAKEGSDYVSEPRGTSGPARYLVGFSSVVKGSRESESAALQAKRISEALRNAIDGYKGIVSDGLSPESTLSIQGIFHDGTEPHWDDKTGTHRFLSAYEVVTEEQRPPTI